MSNTRLAKAASVIMVMTLVNKAVGFLRDSLVASTFGTTYQTDAYNMAMQICDVLFIMIALAISTTFIPMLSEVQSRKGKEEMFNFANNILNILMGISLYLLLNHNNKKQRNNLVGLFVIQFIFNFIWSALFFNLRNIFVAAIDITLLVIFLSVLMYQLWLHHRLAMWLMIPYYLWVLFATLLNYSIYFLN